MTTQKKTMNSKPSRGQRENGKARMEKFCVAYFAKPNATEAAIKAGYAAKNCCCCW